MGQYLKKNLTLHYTFYVKILTLLVAENGTDTTTKAHSNSFSKHLINNMIISIGTFVCSFLLMMILREIHRYRLFPIPADQQHTLQSSSEVEDIYLEINARNVLV